MDETTDKEKAGNQPACHDLHSLIFQLTIYIAQTLSNLTVYFERGAEVSMYLLMRKITNETLDPHCCRSLVAFKISPNPDYHLITLTEMI